MDDESHLSRKKVLYGLSLEGDHDHRCYFENLGEAFLAALDPIFVRDIIGFADIDHPSNGRYSDFFRFENSLRVTRFVVMSDDVNAVKISTNIRIPDIISNIRPVSFVEFTNNIINDAIFRKELKIDMLMVKGSISDVWASWSQRVVIEELLMFYYSNISKFQTLEDVRNNINQGVDVVEPSLSMDAVKPTINSESLEKTSIHITRIVGKAKKGESVGDLFRRAAFSEDSQRYVLSEDFYKMLWKRDLPQFYFDEAAFPDFYLPNMTFSWNYNRLLDVKTVEYWLKTQQMSHDYPNVSNSDIRLIRFPLKDLRGFNQIQCSDSCFGKRITLRIDTTRNYFVIDCEDEELINEHIMKFIPEENLWYRRGFLPGTVVPDPRSLQIGLHESELSVFLESTLNYLVRSRIISRIRFG